MCGTGDINVQDFKAHAVIVGGSWHFREKVGGAVVPLINLFFTVRTKYNIMSMSGFPVTIDHALRHVLYKYS